MATKKKAPAAKKAAVKQTTKMKVKMVNGEVKKKSFLTPTDFLKQLDAATAAESKA